MGKTGGDPSLRGGGRRSRGCWEGALCSPCEIEGR